MRSESVFFEVRKFHNVGKLLFFYSTDEKTTQDLPDMCGEINADLVKLKLILKYTWEHIRLLKIQGSSLIF